MKINKSSLIFKYIIIFILFILIPVYVCSIVLIKEFENILIENNISKNLQITEQISYKISDAIKSYKHTAASIIHDTNLLSDIINVKSNISREEKLKVQTNIEYKLQNYYNYTTDLIGVVFVYKQNGYYYYKNPPMVSSDVMKQKPWYQLMIDKSIENKVELLTSSDNFLYSNSGVSKAISLAVIPDMKSSKDIEMIYFAFRPNVYKDVYTKFNLSDDWSIQIINEHNEPIIQSGLSCEALNDITHKFTDEYGYIPYEKDGQKTLITYYKVPGIDWKVIGSVPYSTLTKDIHIVSEYISVAYIVIVVIFFIVFIMTSLFMLVIPIKKLVVQMRQVKKGNFNLKPFIHGKSELSQLSENFYSMVKELKNLITKVEEKEIEKSNLEIKSLQYQINPHFLFNTLNTITTMAETCGVVNIERMLRALTTMLMNTIDKNGSLSTVNKTIETIRSYEYIMKIKYNESFKIIYNIDDSTKDLFVPKMVLQPIVENSIIHGLKDVFTPITIIIDTTISDNMLIITVNDDGIGMSQEDMKSLLETHQVKNDGFNKLGIYNVHKKIQLNFGVQYGITFSDNLPLGGVKTSIKLPIIKNCNNDQNVVNGGN